MSNATPPRAPPNGQPPQPAQQLWNLWREGRRPEVCEFLARVHDLPPAQLAAVLLVDQRERWQVGERLLAEWYLALYPAHQPDFEYALELIYGEFLLREGQHEAPALDEYRRRFPLHAARLELQVELHRALQSDASPGPGDGTAPHLATPEAAAVGERRVPYGGVGPAIPGYVIEGELGRGGMGIVYKARQISLGRTVALKMLRAGEQADPEQRARFHREAQAAARLQHPNVVQIHETGGPDGAPYFAMEYVDGGSLADQLAGTPQPARPAARLIEVLSRAVHYAHGHGVVHRDLKPSNILLASRGLTPAEPPEQDLRGSPSLAPWIPKVADFGLAKCADEGGVRQTRSGAVMGTPCYMAPEQAEGRTQAIGVATDVYALGAILYELLTGRPPFRAATLLETLDQVRSAEAVPPSHLQPSLPRDLETICLKCLHKEPHRRYPSAAALADDVGRFLKDRPIQARPLRLPARLGAGAVGTRPWR